MSMNWKVAIGAGAVIGVGVLAACADPVTGPTSRSAFIPKSSFAVGEVVNPTAIATELRICKSTDSDAPGTFTITSSPAVSPGPSNTPENPRAGGTGNPTVMTPITVQPGQCRIVAVDLGDANQESGDFFSITEIDAPNVTESIVGCTLNGGAAIPCNNFYFINTAHGVTVTYRNIADAPPPPPARCTYTKGWYQNKHATDGKDRDIIAGIDGLDVATQSLIFNTQPNKKATITWDGGNNSLNLYQQFLAALNNLNNVADAGPADVDAAIALVAANTSFANGHITVTLTAAQVSASINTLSSFNEGKFAGYPHCG